MPERITINRDTVLHLSWLARISLSEEEIEKMQKELSMILSYMEDILTIDVQSEESMYFSQGRLRKDEVVASEGENALPQEVLEDKFVKGPKVYKG